MKEHCGHDDNCVKIELPKDLENIEVCIDYINKNRRNDIWIDVSDDKQKIRLDFLKYIAEPQSVDKMNLSGNFAFSDVLYDFTELRELSYDPYGVEVIDLARFPKLERLTTISPKSLTNAGESSIKKYGQFNSSDIKIDVISKFPVLEDIRLHGPKNFKFDNLACQSHLEYISIVQCNIKDLKGIEKFTQLRKVDLTYCRSLESIVGLSALPSLSTVLLDGCPRLKDLDELGRISSLRALYLIGMKNRDLGFLKNMASKKTLECLMLKGSGSMPSIEFLNDYTNLQAFDCLYTNVVDGDLTPLLRLESARASSSRHYNYKRKDLPFGRAFYDWY